jgi:hypothetical protein
MVWNWDPHHKNICEPTSPGSTAFLDDYSEKESEGQPFPTYDTRRYQRNKYYPFYSVLLIEWKNGVAYRLGSGQVHVDAFEYANQFRQLVILG